tara:strand:+ start:16277 stop:16900 length:624 start_codon:yes stop_codon:yes gene_type:complete
MSNGVSLSRYAMKNREQIARNQLAERGEELEKQESKRDFFEILANTIVDIGTSAFLGGSGPAGKLAKVFLDPAIDKYAIDPLTDHIYGEVGEASADPWGFTAQEAKQINKAFEEDGQSYLELLSTDLAGEVGKGGLDKTKEGLGKTTNEFFTKLFKGESVFEEGGRVSKYYGGGSVSGVPTISDYFSKQGKTLGGSNKQSLSQILGR